MLPIVTWTVDPVMLQLGSIHIAWYGAFFALGLIIFGYGIVTRMWEREGLPEKWLLTLFYVVVIGTVVGARLGHCLFYDPAYYLAHPGEIIKIWHGGLASHGGVLGIILGVWWYSRRITHKSMLWTFDRLVVPTGLVAALIRIGNLFNHEIYRHATNVPWAFRYITNIRAWQAGADPVFTAPSHPTQLYEATCYLLTFALCMWLYWKKDMQKRQGFLFGVFMVCVFTARFVIEFVKNDQSAFEASMPLNMGQLLSIPFIVVGIGSIVYSLKRPAVPVRILTPQEIKAKRAQARNKK